jgi:hypothetical protein
MENACHGAFRIDASPREIQGTAQTAQCVAIDRNLPLGTLTCAAIPRSRPHGGAADPAGSRPDQRPPTATDGPDMRDEFRHNDQQE